MMRWHRHFFRAKDLLPQMLVSTENGLTHISYVMTQKGVTQFKGYNGKWIWAEEEQIFTVYTTEELKRKN